ncbi:unnamed protein product [Parnassius apollo]|uniref:(apollo) hypothetical protein n=1 Tax=Parnassius apollo TaxID=110799 RepID=A0A8S3WPI1_PARAO|nr:unnamed protein product [Parnassius apollo]
MSQFTTLELAIIAIGLDDEDRSSKNNRRRFWVHKMRPTGERGAATASCQRVDAAQTASCQRVNAAQTACLQCVVKRSRLPSSPDSGKLAVSELSANLRCQCKIYLKSNT